MNTENTSFLRRNRKIFIFLGLMLILPFVVGLFEGSTPSMVWANQGTVSKFLQGLIIEVFILAMFALSYDLLFGITGLLSFGHSMFFAVAAYTTGIAIKTLALPFWQVLLLVLGMSILQALLFSLVLPRVKGVTFTLVSLGLASVFHLIIMSSDMAKLTGADTGLQGVISPDFINPVYHRFRFYAIAAILLVVIYLFYKRFIASPTGRVCVAIRENEDRAKMLGYNTTTFKIIAMLISSMTASIAGVLHTLYHPIVSPTIADLGQTVMGLLVVLIGGVSTLSGSIVGAFLLRFLDFFLRRFMGESASFITGAIYVIFVLFVPYGIVGTINMRKFNRKQGWQRLLKLFSMKTGNSEELRK